ncbi:hypothetical protein DSCA_47200 [Desulfosarcina alkanivorans]|uniref:PKD/Chitinase domain-containing protein n=1 Tax=Desulfosarcina alkanivorans TaxID=571177 RepID=A0A5K7YR02_9BACT|nr:PKD domain-containing protein [Desulfosarcina alkanivorans]BBO70790.1 hypothetical protein DSCA_47200 [Desulfosarcina alkanivorans]
MSRFFSAFRCTWFCLALGITLFLLPMSLWASIDVSLAWDANSERLLAGYRVFTREAGSAYDYRQPCWEGTNTTCTLPGLDEQKTHYFVVRAFDTQGAESADSDEVRWDPESNPLNIAPQADAGPDQSVGQNAVVTLSGCGSTDSDGAVSAFYWKQIGGPAVALLDSNAEETTFTAPEVSSSGATLVFQLTVADQEGMRATDTCTVNVSWNNEPPQAFAGEDQNISAGATAVLNGDDSFDPDGSIATYQWKQIDGPRVTSPNPSAARPTFQVPSAGVDGVSLQFELTVTDNGGLTATDACIVNIRGVNRPPVAAADQESLDATAGTEVVLDGASSYDTDGGIAAYHWRQTFGPPVTLSDASSSRARFQAPTDTAAGDELNFTLTVTDHDGARDTVDVSVYVASGNEPPHADAGEDQQVLQYSLFTLDARGSFDNDDGLAGCKWTQIAGSPVTLYNSSSSTSPTPVVRAPRVNGSETLTFRLTVTDRQGATDSDTVDVTVLAYDQDTDDTTPPVISVTSPATSYAIYTRASAIDLRGTASDNVGVKSISWSNSRGGSGTAIGTSSWSVGSLPVAVGYNAISLTAEDTAGNTTKRVLYVIRYSY